MTMDPLGCASPQRNAPARWNRRFLFASGLCALICVVAIGVVGWWVIAGGGGGGGNGPWGDPSAPEEDLPGWSAARVNGYQQRLATIAAWVQATHPKPGVYPGLQLPPAMANLVTHGPMEGIVAADGQVVLLIQFYDFNLSDESAGVVYATTPFRPQQIGTVPAGAPMFNGATTFAFPSAWQNSLSQRVTANLYMADLTTDPQ